jgi:hypothetical protein
VEATAEDGILIGSRNSATTDEKGEAILIIEFPSSDFLKFSGREVTVSAEKQGFKKVNNTVFVMPVSTVDIDITLSP